MPEVRHERLPNVEAIAHFNDKVLLTTQSYAELKAYEHALAFTVAKIADQDMLSEVHKAVKQAIESGTSFNDFKKTLKPYLMAKGWLGLTDSQSDKTYLGHRLKTIYHTNKQTAYAAGRWQRIQRTKEMLPYLQYLPSLSTNKRDSHTAYYGLVRPVDDPIWQSIFPPNGFGCKCRTKQLTRTKAQKILDEQEKAGKSYDIEMEEVKHPLTGEMVSTPKGVHFSFNHNHDRLSAMIKLAEDKHDSPFTAILKAQLTDFMLDMAKNKGVAVASFAGIVARPSEINRLKMELDGTESLSEGVVGDEWQQKFGVMLERYNPKMHKVLVVEKPADFAIIDNDKPLKEWTIIDFMMTTDPDKVAGMNAFFMDTRPKHRDRAWRGLYKQILDHLEKSDIVPIDLRNLYVENRVKIISYVLSLPKEQQKQIVFITG